MYLQITRLRKLQHKKLESKEICQERNEIAFVDFNVIT